ISARGARMAGRAERAILDICEREATPPAGMPRAESRYRNSRYGPLAKLRLKPPRGSASLDCCLLALAPLGRHLLRASETCFIRHDVGLRRCLVAFLGVAERGELLFDLTDALRADAVGEADAGDLADIPLQHLPVVLVRADLAAT